MGTLQSTLLYLILLHSFSIVAYKDQEWKKATATYANDTEESLITEGACGYRDLHKASYVNHSAGLSTSLFNRGSSCGACYEIRCVDHVLWCMLGNPSVIVTITDSCAPNYGLSVDCGGWCNFPKEHFELSHAAFAEIVKRKANIVPIQYRRVKCERSGGLKYTTSGSSHFYQVLITNVGLDGEVVAVKVKGSGTGWIPLTFEVTISSGETHMLQCCPGNWQFGQTFKGK